MLIPDRRRRILEEVRRHGSASVEGLAATLGVSGSTVRRDLDDLEQQGLLGRAHGGAVLLGSDTGTPAWPGGTAEDLAADGEAKVRIGAHAASLVADGSTVMMLAGSTTAAMVPALYHRRLTVVTNGLEIANALKHAPHIDLVVLGGYLHREQMTMLGPMTVAAMSALHADVMVGGAWGVHAATGVTGNKIIQAGDHRSAIERTDRLVILADATKIGRRGPTMLADLDHVDTLVTDREAPRAHLDAIEARGVSVAVV